MTGKLFKNKVTDITIVPKKKMAYMHINDYFNAWEDGKYDKNSSKKVQVGKDQEKAQSEKDSHSKNRGGKKPN